jgi:putative hydrolase of the HAD superfamily
MDGAIELLNQLHTKVRLGLITNGLKEVQRPRIFSTGLNKYFEVIVVSGEIDIMKPDYAFFEYTYGQMSRPAKERVLVVGDNLNADIRGGFQFGFKTCWFNPGASVNQHGVSPDYEINLLSGVVDIVDNSAEKI